MFSREFKLEAVRLIEERGVSVVQASRDLDIGEGVLRRWVKKFGAEYKQAFPGQGRRTLVMLSGPVRLRLKIRRCDHERCARHRVPCRPEVGDALALSRHEFGLGVVTLMGTLRHHDHRSVPELHALLRGEVRLVAAIGTRLRPDGRA